MAKTIQVTDELKLVQIEPYVWEIPPYGDMLVPGRIYGDWETVDHLVDDVKAGKEWNALAQIVNVACLPGIQVASMAMADVHPKVTNLLEAWWRNCGTSRTRSCRRYGGRWRNWGRVGTTGDYTLEASA